MGDKFEIMMEEKLRRHEEKEDQRFNSGYTADQSSSDSDDSSDADMPPAALPGDIRAELHCYAQVLVHSSHAHLPKATCVTAGLDATLVSNNHNHLPLM